MSVTKHKNDVYYLEVTILGKRYRESLKTKDYKEAKQRAEQRKIDLYTKARQQQEMSLEELAQRYFKEKHFNTQRTKKSYKDAIKLFKKKDVEEYKENTRNNIWRHLKALYNWGQKQGYVNINPYSDKPTQSIPKVDYYSDKEVKEILNSLGNKKAHDLIRFAFNTGARRGELTNLSPKDINEHNIVLHGKTGSRRFPIKDNEELQAILERGKVFGYSKPSAVSSAFTRHNLSATKIRHTFATRLVKNGMKIFKVSKLLGHSSVTTTERYYAHLKPTDIEGVDKVLNL